MPTLITDMGARDTTDIKLHLISNTYLKQKKILISLTFCTITSMRVKLIHCAHARKSTGWDQVLLANRV